MSGDGSDNFPPAFARGGGGRAEQHGSAGAASAGMYARVC